MAPAKARPVNLRDHEARRLREAGRVLVVRAVDRRPRTPTAKLCRCGADRPGLWTFVDGDPDDIETWGEVGSPFACPFGPVGGALWGREAWALAIRVGASIHSERVPHYKADGDVLPGWKPSVHMPMCLSRFPRLRLATCGARRLGATKWGGATWEDVVAAGLPDQPRKVVRPGSVPCEYLPIGPADMLAGLLGIAAGAWCWFATVEVADGA